MKRISSSLLLLLFVACGGGSDPDEPAALVEMESTPKSWFVDFTEISELDFVHAAGFGGDYDLQEIGGSGGALFDYDGDGDLDAYLVNGGSKEGGAPNRMYRQESDGTFVDVTIESGLGEEGYGVGAALGDIDNDGDLDLLVTNSGPDTLFVNEGGGRFRAEAASGVGDDKWSTSACFFDYDADGALDLYVVTYVDFYEGKRCTDKAGRPDFCGPAAFAGLRDRVFRGRGDGSFTEVSDEVFPDRPKNKGLGVVCADFDGDGRTDAYVANDGEENQLWLNRTRPDGSTVFEDRALVLGAALNRFGKPEAGMGLAVGDVDGDLDLDLFVTHLNRETNTLYLNHGAAGFEDSTAASGLGPAGLRYTGFGTVFFDADLDGDLDLATVNGRVSRGPTAEELEWSVEPGVPPLLTEYAEPNLFFTGDGGGSFTESSAEAGELTATAEVSRGLLPGDLDRDGDLDLVVINCGSAARLYRNEAPRAGRWLEVRAVEGSSGRAALGASVVVQAGERKLARPLISTLSFLSAVEPVAHFGLGDASRVDQIEVVWPDGSRERFPGTEADRAVEVRKGEGSPL